MRAPRFERALIIASDLSVGVPVRARGQFAWLGDAHLPSNCRHKVISARFEK